MKLINTKVTAIAIAMSLAGGRKAALAAFFFGGEKVAGPCICSDKSRGCHLR